MKLWKTLQENKHPLKKAPSQTSNLGSNKSID